MCRITAIFIMRVGGVGSIPEGVGGLMMQENGETQVVKEMMLQKNF